MFGTSEKSRNLDLCVFTKKYFRKHKKHYGSVLGNTIFHVSTFGKSRSRNLLTSMYTIILGDVFIFNALTKLNEYLRCVKNSKYDGGILIYLESALIFSKEYINLAKSTKLGRYPQVVHTFGSAWKVVESSYLGKINLLNL